MRRLTISWAFSCFEQCSIGARLPPLSMPWDHSFASGSLQMLAKRSGDSIAFHLVLLADGTCVACIRRVQVDHGENLEMAVQDNPSRVVVDTYSREFRDTVDDTLEGVPALPWFHLYDLELLPVDVPWDSDAPWWATVHLHLLAQVVLPVKLEGQHQPEVSQAAQSCLEAFPYLGLK